MHVPLAALLISIIVTFALSRLLLDWSPRLGLLDFPGERKQHSINTPLGGLAIISGCLLGVIALLPLEPIMIGWIAGAVGVGILGLVDDRWGLSALQKLLGQILCALAPILIGGFVIQSLQIFGFDLELGLFAIPLTLLWLVAITNAFNLIDGLDGLAAGVVLIAAVAFGILSLEVGNESALIIASALAGTSLGFLIFNSHPAKIFPGDGGSYFWGFSLAMLAIVAIQPSGIASEKISIVFPIIILLYPIADTFWAIIRRLRARKSIFSADQEHIHHKLLKTALGYRKAVWILYGIATAFAGIALLTFFSVN